MAPSGKAKKKWSKGKVKDKAQHAVLFEKTVHDRLLKEVTNSRVVSVASLVDRFKINGSLARKTLTDLEEQGIIVPVIKHSKCYIYTRAVSADAE